MSSQPGSALPAVFLSYARDDAVAARRIADALRGFGVEVWFDQNELRGGDAWDAKIKRQIRECALFMPIVSAATQARGEGYFRREWKQAVDRSYDMAAGIAFIVPVVIDDTPEARAMVPDEFMRPQWTRLPEGRPTPEFVTQVKRLLDAPRNVAPAARSTHETAGREPGRAARRPRAPAAMAALAVTLAAIGIIAWQWQRQPAADTPRNPPAPGMAAATPAPLAAPRPKDDKSIAVLPFANMSEDKDSNVFFSDGIHEDILTNLALIRELRVVSRTSVMQYRATTKPIRQIAQELGVAYILEGSVRRSGNKVRVTGQLIRGSNDEHVWAKNYDRDLTDVFTIQAALAQEIASALQAALSPQERANLERRPTENPAAYDGYLQARELRRRLGNTPEMVQQTTALLENATRLDPQFVEAWVDLAYSHATAYFWNQDHTSARRTKAQQAIETAARLAPGSPSVLRGLGDYYYYAFRDYDRAQAQYRRVVEQFPNDPTGYSSLGFIARRRGQWSEALAQLKKAVELDRGNLVTVRALAQLHVQARRYEEAAAWSQEVLRLLPNSLMDQMQAAAIPYFARGSAAEAKAWAAALPASARSSPQGIDALAITSMHLGDAAELLRLAALPGATFSGTAPWQRDAGIVIPALLKVGDKMRARTLAETTRAEIRSLLEAQPANDQMWGALALTHAVLGDKPAALEAARKVQELLPETRDQLAGVQNAASIAVVYALVGEIDRAVDEVERLLAKPYGPNVHELRFAVPWFPLQGNPRLQTLIDDPKHNAPRF